MGATLAAGLAEAIGAIGADGGWIALESESGLQVVCHLGVKIDDAGRPAGDETGCLLAAPLQPASQVLGLLSVITRRPHAYAAADVRLVAGVGARLAAAIESTLAPRGLGLAERSRVLLEAAETINSNLASSALAATILAEAARLVDAQACALLVVRGDVLVAQEVLGLSDRCRRLFVVPLEGSVYGRAVVSGVIATIEDVDVEGLGDSVLPCDLSWRSMLVAPLASHRATYGALALYSDQPQRFADDEKAAVRMFAIQAAIALDNQRLLQEKEELAVRDGLTGVYNRSYLELAMERAAKDLRRNGGDVSVLFLDVDGMKQVNDSCGHQAGDRLLIDLATLLQQCCRETDVVARYGGDEFVVLMPGTDAEGASRVSSKVDDVLKRHNAVPGGSSLFASLGTHTAGAADIDDLLREADRRMYASKRSRFRR